MYSRYGFAHFIKNDKFNEERGRLSNDSQLFTFNVHLDTEMKSETAISNTRRLDSMNYKLEEFYRNESLSKY